MANEVSPGNAIGLNYRIPNSNYIADVVGKHIDEGKAAQKAAAAQVAKNKKIYDDNADNLNKFVLDQSSGIIPNLQGDIKAAAANVMKINDEEYAKDPQGYDPNTNKALRAAKYNLNDLHERHSQSSKKVLEAQKEYLSHPDDYDLSPEYDAAFKSGGYNDLLDAINGKNSTDRHDIVTGSGILIPKDKIDWYKTTIDSAQNTKPPVLSTETGGTTIETQRWTPKQKEDLFNTFSTTQNGKLANSAVRQIKASNPSLSDEQAFGMFKNTFIKNIPDVYKQSEITPKEASESDKEKLTASDITNITYTAPNPKKPNGVDEITTRGFTLPSNVTLNVPSDTHVFNRLTKKPLMVSDADGKQTHYVGQLNITGGSIGIDSEKHGDKYTFTPFLFATATSADGKEKMEVQIPISKLRGQKTLEKYASEAADAIQKEADEMNNKKSSPKTDVKVDSQEAWNKKWASLKPGQRLIGLDGKTYSKK